MDDEIKEVLHISDKTLEEVQSVLRSESGDQFILNVAEILERLAEQFKRLHDIKFDADVREL